MPQAKTHNTPIDTLGARLVQARAALNAIQNTYDAKDGYLLPEKCLHEALWAVEEIIDQANRAYDNLCDDQEARNILAA